MTATQQRHRRDQTVTAPPNPASAAELIAVNDWLLIVLAFFLADRQRYKTSVVRVLGVLSTYADFNTGRGAHPSRDTLVAWGQFSTRTTTTAVTVAEKDGLLEVEQWLPSRSFGRLPVYRLTAPLALPGPVADRYEAIVKHLADAPGITVVEAYGELTGGVDYGPWVRVATAHAAKDGAEHRPALTPGQAHVASVIGLLCTPGASGSRRTVVTLSGATRRTVDRTFDRLDELGLSRTAALGRRRGGVVDIVERSYPDVMPAEVAQRIGRVEPGHEALTELSRMSCAPDSGLATTAEVADPEETWLDPKWPTQRKHGSTRSGLPRGNTAEVAYPEETQLDPKRPTSSTEVADFAPRSGLPRGNTTPTPKGEGGEPSHLSSLRSDAPVSNEVAVREWLGNLSSHLRPAGRIYAHLADTDATIGADLLGHTARLSAAGWHPEVVATLLADLPPERSVRYSGAAVVAARLAKIKGSPNVRTLTTSTVAAAHIVAELREHDAPAEHVATILERAGSAATSAAHAHALDEVRRGRWDTARSVLQRRPVTELLAVVESLPAVFVLPAPSDGQVSSWDM